MNIALAAVEDAGEIMTVQRAAYVSEAQLYDNTHFSALSEPVDSVRSAIETGVVLVARVGPRIVGAVRGRIDGPVCHVERLVVAPDQQGQGVGRELMLAVEEHVPPSVERFALHTGDRSAANLHLYRKVGYEQTRAERIAATLSLIHMEKPPRTADKHPFRRNRPDGNPHPIPGATRHASLPVPTDIFGVPRESVDNRCGC